jgi:micrococcal nuclease
MKKILIIIVFLMSGICTQAQIQVLADRIVDGDGIEGRVVRKGVVTKKVVNIRLTNTDAPGCKNPTVTIAQIYGERSKFVLDSLIKGKVVTVKFTGKWSYNRRLGRVKYNGYWLDNFMIANGHAWADEQAPVTSKRYQLQLFAKSKERGLWNPKLYDTTSFDNSKRLVSPWDFRDLFSTRKK